MTEIRNVNSKDIESIINLVTLNKDILQPNNFMIYYLCCTVFKESSFIAFKDEKPIGFLLAFPDSKQEYTWVHQMGVDPNEKSKGIGSELLKKLETSIASLESPIKTMRLAVKPDNHRAKVFYEKHQFRFLGMDDLIKMEIYEKLLNTSPNSQYK